MEEITVSDGAERSSYITYIYNHVMGELTRAGGNGELMFGDRAVLTIHSAEKSFRKTLRECIAEVIGVGYKYRFLDKYLKVCLGRREKRLLCAALIAADLEGDKAYIISKLEGCEEYSIDGFYSFRLVALREKWDKIINYIPTGFGGADLKRFCDFLVGESHRKIYVKGQEVFGENFVPLRRSRLLGVEEPEMEIMLSDAGFVYCLGKVQDSLGDFLQKYYAERAVFS